MRSGRGVSPKIASDTVTEPAASPARVVTVNSMSRPLLAVWRGSFALCRGRCALGGSAELAGFRRLLRKRLLDRIAHHDPAAFGAGHGAFNQNEAAFGIGLHDAQIEGGDALDTQMPGHLLVLESLAGILPAAGASDRAMRDRNAMRGAQAAEVPALHATGKTL